MFKNILLATDGSRLCNESVKAAIALAKSCGSSLVGLSVSGNLRALSIPEVSVGVDLARADEAGRARALASVEMITEMARQEGVPCSVQVAQGGRPYEEIMRGRTRALRCHLHGFQGKVHAGTPAHGQPDAKVAGP